MVSMLYIITTAEDILLIMFLQEKLIEFTTENERREDLLIYLHFNLRFVPYLIASCAYFLFRS